MNDEYLWNKTGNDPEIEKLEKALAVYRYREVIASVPIEEPVYKSVPRWRLSFAFAFASCVAVAMLAVGWVQISKYNTSNADEIVFVQQSTSESDADSVVEPKLPPVRNSDETDRPPATPRRRAIRPTSASYRPVKKKDAAPKDGIAALTSEERYAYRQLMVALSITGTKLRIVQDTIDGAENTDDNASKYQR